MGMMDWGEGGGGEGERGRGGVRWGREKVDR